MEEDGPQPSPHPDPQLPTEGRFLLERATVLTTVLLALLSPLSVKVTFLSRAHLAPRIHPLPSLAHLTGLLGPEGISLLE